MNTTLPSAKDFNPWGGDGDAMYAWKNFGGLTIEEAYKKFCDNPLGYQEDFMWMGTKAFEYYFPVLEKYLQEIQPEDELDDCEGWIIGCGIEMQLNEDCSIELTNKIEKLTDQVIYRFSNFDIDQEQVIYQWNKIKNKIKS